MVKLVPLSGLKEITELMKSQLIHFSFRHLSTLTRPLDLSENTTGIILTFNSWERPGTRCTQWVIDVFIMYVVLFVFINNNWLLWLLCFWFMLGCCSLVFGDWNVKHSNLPIVFINQLYIDIEIHLSGCLSAGQKVLEEKWKNIKHLKKLI